MDNRFLRTFLFLIRYPEDVINGYITGRRRGYVSPLNFYLITVSLLGLQIFLLRQFAPDTLQIESIAKGSDQVFVSVMDTIYDYYGFFNTLNLPIYTLTGYLIYKNLKKYNFTEHFIFNLYVFAILNIIAFLLTIPMLIFQINYGIVGVVLTPVTIIYLFYAYGRSLRLSTWRTLLKAVLYIHLLGLFLGMLILLVVMIGAWYVIRFQPEWIELLKPQ